MKQLNFQTIDKKLAKKNAELLEFRKTRQKLADKEKEICASIDKLQNQKIEVIFAQVKKEIKNENLNVSSASIIPLLDVLRTKHQVADDKKIEEPANKPTENFSKENSKIGNTVNRLDSISDIIQK